MEVTGIEVDVVRDEPRIMTYNNMTLQYCLKLCYFCVSVLKVNKRL